MGHPGVNLNDAAPENSTLEPKITTLTCRHPEYSYDSLFFLNFPIGAIINFSIFFE